MSITGTEIRIQREALRSIREQLFELSAEAGGMLGTAGDETISEFVFDKGCGSCPGIYRPDTGLLNACLAGWDADGILFCGMVHNHINGSSELSLADIRYAVEILKCFPELPEIVMLLVCNCELYAFKVDREGNTIRSGIVTAEQ